MMRAVGKHYRWLVILLGLVGSLAWAANEATDSVRYQVHWINKTRVHAIHVDLNDPTLLVTPALAWDVPGKRQSFISFLARHQPLAQITGSYFDTRSGYPIGDVVVGGQIKFRGPVGSALAITADNNPSIVNIPFQWKYSWPGYESVLQGGVRLVQNRKYAVYPKQYGFKDPALFRRATRTAIGVTANKKLLMVAVNKPVLLSDLAGIMKALECTDAMTLDGGTSTGLAFGSEIILCPGRTLSNVLMVVKRPISIEDTIPFVEAETTAEADTDDATVTETDTSEGTESAEIPRTEETTVAN